MDIKHQNLITIEKLERNGVKIGNARRDTEHNVNRNLTLQSELISCGILLRSFPSSIHNVELLTQDHSKADIIVDNNYYFQVKQILLSNIEEKISNILTNYSYSRIKDNRFIQVIISIGNNVIDEPIIEEREHLLDGYACIEVLFELEIYKDEIIKKIVQMYRKMPDKEKIIPIIDIKKYPNFNYEHIQHEIHKRFSKKGYILLLIVCDSSSERCPVEYSFFPLFHPKEKYQATIDIIKSSISTSPFIYPYEYSFSGKNLKTGEPINFERSSDGSFLIDNQKICKSLLANKSFMQIGVSSKKGAVEELLAKKNGKDFRMGIAYPKNPRKKKNK